MSETTEKVETIETENVEETKEEIVQTETKSNFITEKFNAAKAWVSPRWEAVKPTVKSVAKGAAFVALGAAGTVVGLGLLAKEDSEPAPVEIDPVVEDDDDEDLEEVDNFDDETDDVETEKTDEEVE